MVSAKQKKAGEFELESQAREENAADESAGGGGRRRQGRGVRARILNSLKKVEDGDQLIEGTEIGQKQLEKFMGFLDKLGNNERGAKLKTKVEELLSPVEIDEGFQFDAEGVTKLVSFLEEQPSGDGARQGGARMRGRGRAGGRAGGMRRRLGQGQAGGPGMRGRRGQGAAGGQRRRGAGVDDLREAINELKDKVEKLSD